MEENTNQDQVTTQTSPTTTTDSKKSNSNLLMLLLMLGLFVTFAILIFAINRNIEADYLSVLRPADILNPKPPVPTSSTQGQVEGTDSIEVLDTDMELQDLTNDAQGL